MTDPRQIRCRLRIGELARLAGVTTRTVRHYHEVGVLPEPHRDTSGYRRYSHEDLLDLHRIVRLRAAAVPLEQIVLLREAEWDDAAMTETLTAKAEQVHDEIERLLSLHHEIRTLVGQLPYDLAALPPGHTIHLDLRAPARSAG